MTPPTSILTKKLLNILPASAYRTPRSWAFRNKARVKIWWQTGLPIRLGIDNGSFMNDFEDIGDLGGAFDGRTIWINERVFDEPDWQTRTAWLLRHEILHAKIAAIRCAQTSWLGRRRWNLVCQAAIDAWALSQEHPDLTELAALLDQYEDSCFDDIEEALVRIIQLLEDGHPLPTAQSLEKALIILAWPGGLNPLNIVRILAWLPWVGWTVRTSSQ